MTDVRSGKKTKETDFSALLTVQHRSTAIMSGYANHDDVGKPLKFVNARIYEVHGVKVEAGEVNPAGMTYAASVTSYTGCNE